MQHSEDRDGEAFDVGAVFADPAFAELKARGAPFAVLKPGSGDVLWANAAAAAHWAAADAASLGATLFGAAGRGGWLDGLDRGLVPERPPRLARAPGPRGPAALLRAWVGIDGELLVGLAVPDADDGSGLEAWRRPAWAARDAAPAGAAPDGAEAAPPAAEDPAEPPADPGEAGPALARRSQLAVVRDRLGRAVDGAATLRLLWRTDAAGAVLAMDEAALARLGSPLRFGKATLPDAVAPFDPEAAERLRSALAARATWGGLAFRLPVAAGAATVPMALSGSPAFGPDRTFAGFRGFGTIDLGALALADRPVPAEAEREGAAAPGPGPDAPPSASAASAGPAAAAARLGRADPAALLGGAPSAAPDGSGRLVLRDAAGGTATLPARRADASWAGEPAVLWLLDEPGGAAPEAGADAPPPAPAEDRAVDLLDRVDDAVALLDAAGRLRRLNGRGAAWFGHAEVGLDFTELLAPESRAAALALLGEVRHQRDGLAAPPLRRDVLARTGEDGAVPMLLTLGRLGASGFYATLRDVSALRLAETDRARTERDHARSSGRLPDLLAKLSHEIRTPLGAILGFAEVMMDERFGPLGNPRYKDYLKDIHASGAQVVALVDDLLDLSRIEAGQVALDIAAVDVNRVVAEAVAQMQPEAHRGRIIMRTSLAGRAPAALADERAARQIVRNLLSNAVKFNEPGGQVIVSTALGEAGAVLLRVRDTGVGMTDEEIASALEPFGGMSPRASAHGNRLGLPLTRALVGANGASMTIRSRPREGTLVEVAFAPADAGEARRPA